MAYAHAHAHAHTHEEKHTWIHTHMNTHTSTTQSFHTDQSTHIFVLTNFTSAKKSKGKKNLFSIKTSLYNILSDTHTHTHTHTHSGTRDTHTESHRKLGSKASAAFFFPPQGLSYLRVQNGFTRNRFPEFSNYFIISYEERLDVCVCACVCV